MKNQLALNPAVGGWPKLSQIHNELKMIRGEQGARSTVEAMMKIVQARQYHPNIVADAAFLFGYKTDLKGNVYVGKGENDDPFIIGITSLLLIGNFLKFASSDRFSLFHADATFKMSDIGYPVITCGFPDQTRSYQVGTIFVVSRCTAVEYGHCFRSFAKLVHRVRGQSLHISAVMGDAEDAQANAFVGIPKFSSANVLFPRHIQCTQAYSTLSDQELKVVMTSIMDMHFCQSSSEFVTCKERELQRWRAMESLHDFAEYFEKQWLLGRFWRWQVFDSPSGYATTNNACETFDAQLKYFLQQRRYHMRLLLQKFCDFVGTIPP
jgi:hypothetical protein